MDHDLIVFEKLNIKDITRRPKPKPDPSEPGAYLRNGARGKAGLNRGILLARLTGPHVPCRLERLLASAELEDGLERDSAGPGVTPPGQSW